MKQKPQQSISTMAPLLLASASPRRRELLSILIDDFTIEAADIDETPYAGESAEGYVKRMAVAKAGKVADRHPGRPVLGADTAVVVDGVFLGKPESAAAARTMLESLSARSHLVYSSVCLVDASGHAETALSITRVWFETLPGHWISAYVDSAEPMDKAGAYAIQGSAAAWISRIDGSYSGVVGLPLFETVALLGNAGVLPDCYRSEIGASQ
ncbi:MAG: nucleoside triphosphate pyrophosphatase [Wenzhouxiangellaceae bacterium]|nr:nucleoside triphosphate pyrophosphatase [Wenzhouxiangellaceae bacterium]